jgi:hypothetical protein
VHQSSTGQVYYRCIDCHDRIDEHHKAGMLAAGHWRHQHPERKSKGYHLSGLYSAPGLGVSWAEIWAKWEDAQGDTAKLVTLEGGLPLVAPSGTPEAVLKLLADEAVAWSNTDKAAKLRETFAIPNKPKNLAGTRKDWEGEVPVWIKLAVDLGIKLD